MSSDRGFLKPRGEREEMGRPETGSDFEPGLDPETQNALRNFRGSVRAWSDAIHGLPRAVRPVPGRKVLRVAAAWTLGSLLIAAGIGGGYLQNQHRQERARLAAAHEAERQRQFQEERARQAEQELAQVDRDISREVPNALEPLTGLMAVDESQ